MSKEKFIFVERGTSVRYIEPRLNFSSLELDDFVKSVDCYEVDINKAWGMSQKNVSEVFQCKHVKSLRIIGLDVSFSDLDENSKIEKIYYNGLLKKPFDFSKVDSLKSLSLIWNKNLGNLSCLNNLDELYLSDFKGKSSEFKNINQLKVLCLAGGNLRDVDFLEEFSALKRLELSHLKALTDINGLMLFKGQLEELELSHLLKLTDYSRVIAGLRPLHTLRLDKCNNLADLNFLKELKDLSFFSFVNMDVMSGDLTPCSHIDHLGFIDKKDYNCFWNEDEGKLVRK